MPVIAYASVLTVALLAGPAIVLANAKPVPGEIVLVISPNERGRAALIQQSGGRILGPETALLGALAISDNPDFPDTLKSDGAWLVLDGRQFALLCGVAI